MSCNVSSGDHIVHPIHSFRDNTVCFDSSRKGFWSVVSSETQNNVRFVSIFWTYKNPFKDLMYSKLCLERRRSLVWNRFVLHREAQLPQHKHKQSNVRYIWSQLPMLHRLKHQIVLVILKRIVEESFFFLCDFFLNFLKFSSSNWWMGGMVIVFCNMLQRSSYKSSRMHSQLRASRWK